MRAIFLLTFAASLAGCATETHDPPPTGSLPATFYFEAEAVSGDTISCHLSYRYDVQSEETIDETIEYTGFFGGEAFRSHLQLDGSGEAFWADAGGEFLVRLLPGDSIELGYKNLVPTGESRFWDRQALIAGRLGDPELASGTWSCEPLDVRSDTTGIVQGTWWIQSTPPGQAP
jgi:hypothetical protein